HQCKPQPSEVTPSTLEGRTRLLDATGNAVRAMTQLHLGLARTPILRSDEYWKPANLHEITRGPTHPMDFNGPAPFLVGDRRAPPPSLTMRSPFQLRQTIAYPT